MFLMGLLLLIQYSDGVFPHLCLCRSPIKPHAKASQTVNLAAVDYGRLGDYYGEKEVSRVIKQYRRI